MIETRFKDTEIGKVPVEWKSYTLKSLCDVKRGVRVTREQLSTESLYPVFQNTDYPLGYFNRYNVEANTPFIIIGGSAGLIGYCKENFWAADDCAYFTNCIHLDKGFLYYELLRRKYDINRNVKNASVPRLDRKVIENLIIPLPPLPEQRRIASALTAVDDLLASLDRMIEKKRNIKQGAMQQLLTGKTRLEGFSEPWGEKTLGEIEIKNGSMLRSSDYQLGSIPVIAGGKKPAGYHSVSNRQGHTITISGSGANAGYVAFYDQPIFASDCSTINEQDNIDIKCLFFLLLLKQNDIYKCQAGGAQPHIHAKDIKDISINMPKNISEQRAIARILTDMDDEIAALEKKRDKYVAMKDGMMQQLLTGKIRLVN